ncbi:MAG: AmmeMemoRadiSam system protein A [Desulfobulbaceae bacterium]|nr:AmmeMemoRadiSam system protein A [Desulfobulbaceae bacterium]
MDLETGHTENGATLTERQGQALLCLARSVIARRLDLAEDNTCDDAVLSESALQEHRGVFVTLTIGGQLRGCIGSLGAASSIVNGVRENAINAAFGDPRFHSLSIDEYGSIEIEVSVLTEPQPLDYTDGDDLIAKLRPNIDGIIITKGSARATFLPQVWEQLPQPENFLSHLCQKAMLNANAWRDGTLDVQTYNVQYFHEQR